MGTEITTTTQDVEIIRAEVRPVLDAARAIVVTDEATYGTAMEIAAKASGAAKHVEEVFRPAREAAHKAWKAVTETVASFVGPLDEAKRTCTTKAVRWRQVEETKRQAERRALEDAARKEAEEARLRAAVVLEESGAKALAQRVLDEPIKPLPVEAAAPIRSVARETIRANWQVEVVDFAALVKAVAAGTVDMDVLQPNMTVLRARAKALKCNFILSGVRAWDEGSVAFK